jgi:hypothetical protein
MRDRRAIGGQVVTVCSVAGGVPAMGQTEKYSKRADIFRSPADNRHGEAEFRRKEVFSFQIQHDERPARA